MAHPEGLGRASSFVWHVVPQVALRLGAGPLLPAEADAYSLARLDPRQFRRTVGGLLERSRLHEVNRVHAPAAGTPFAIDLLNNRISQGNPIAFGLDRICAPLLADEDPVTRWMKAASRQRFGHDRFLRWSPGFEDAKGGELEFIC
ncbi:hypothetical protein LAZ40_06700 [Cereibacter sphaeroides]|uniref:hypothetical protein n=1 Tax=Cereibacter sphaeroides TaxID=1063 RepID=UPI001F2C6FF5|nr:hypothetical protein [Cereibacter sphaeroides]MCE6958735.1 hypothetical protein [Cereibacter sphaeroides]MCE6973391.1 hypothetical protein [Cereibacter sphaeroides]